MDNDNNHTGGVNKRLRISLPKVSGALSVLTAVLVAVRKQTEAQGTTQDLPPMPKRGGPTR